MKFNAKGFALIELIVVIVIIATVLSVVSINFSSWQKKYNIENQAKEMMSDLSDLRMRAIRTKSNHMALLSADPKLMTFRSYTSEERVNTTNGKEVFRKYLKYAVMRQKSDGSGTLVTSGDIGITSRGYTQDFQVGGTFQSDQTLVILPAGSGASVDCLVISDARINLGQNNGTGCVFK
jgi:prepilin-type N-terminal cleavage/methylation domain-containing protein